MDPDGPLGESTQGGTTQLLRGSAQLMDDLGDLRFLISPEAFFQTNTEMAERLYAIATEFAQLRGSERVFDLYCGIGTIALTVAARAREVIGVELVESAVADAIENAKLNEIENVSFFAGDIRTSMRELVERVGRPDVCLIDPPRAGLSAKVVRRIIEAGPSRIVYVSCNPTTLAPNAAQLVEAGWSSSACGPSTCSRRHRTSSPSRCSSARGRPHRRPPRRPRPDGRSTAATPRPPRSCVRA